MWWQLIAEERSRGHSQNVVWAYLDNKHIYGIMKFHICDCLHLPFIVALFFRTSIRPSFIPFSCHSFSFLLPFASPSTFTLHFHSSHPSALYSLLWLLLSFLSYIHTTSFDFLNPFSVSQPEILENLKHKITCMNFPRLWTRFCLRQGGAMLDESGIRLTNYLLIIVSIKPRLTWSHFH